MRLHVDCFASQRRVHFASRSKEWEDLSGKLGAEFSVVSKTAAVDERILRKVCVGGAPMRFSCRWLFAGARALHDTLLGPVAAPSGGSSGGYRPSTPKRSASGDWKTSANKRQQLWCYKCKRAGHAAKDCYADGSWAQKR